MVAQRTLAAAAGFAFTLTGGSIAFADSSSQRQWSSDVGFFVAFHFGLGVKARFAAGLEARTLYINTGTTYCGPDGTGGESSFAGVAARVALVGFDQVRLLVGPAAGLGGNRAEVDVELAAGYRFGAERGLVVQPSLGVTLDHPTLRLSYAVPREFSVAVGARTGGEFGSGGCAVVGRPLRDDGGVAPPPTVWLCAPRSSNPEDASRARAAAIWAERAAQEWASVPAFWELANQLEAAGAPRELVARARIAAEDEVRHAISAAAIAAALSGGPIALEPIAGPRRPVARGAAGLMRLVRESWTDGCLGEGLAAALASEEAATAQLPAVVAVQTVIAREEASHARLAWDVLAWANSVAPGIAAHVLAQGPNPQRSEPDDRSGLAGYGCLGPSERPQLLARHHAEATQRLLAWV